MAVEQAPMLTGESLFRPGEKVYMHRCVQTPEEAGVMHMHDFIEIVYVLSGRGIHDANGMVTDALPGNVFLINYRMPHVFRAADRQEPFAAYDLIFTPDFLDCSLSDAHCFEDMDASYLFQSMVRPKEAGEYVQLNDSPLGELRQIFERLFEEYNRRLPGYTDVMRAGMIELIIKMFRIQGTESVRHPGGDAAEMIQRYVQQHYSEPISLQDLARRVFLSDSYLSKILKRETGMSFTAYLQQVRIRQACRLLEAQRGTVEQVRESCGFHDAKFFYQTFKKHTGVTPGVYRKLHRR